MGTESFESRPGPPPLPVPVVAFDPAAQQQPPPPAGRRRWPIWPLVVGGLLLAVAMLGTVGFLAVRAVAPPVRQQWSPQSAEDTYREAREAFAATAGPPGDPRQVADIDGLMSRLGPALRHRQAAAAASMFDFDRMADETLAHPEAPRLGRRDRRGFATGLRTSFTQQFATGEMLDGWTRHEVRRVRPVPGREADEAVVFARHVLEDGTRLRFRWWLRRGGAGWRVYDFQELTEGLPATAAMAVHAGANVKSGGTAAWTVAQDHVNAATTDTVKGDFAAAERNLRKCDGVTFPAEFEARRWMAWGNVHLGQGRYPEAANAYGKARGYVSGLPLAHRLLAEAHLGMGQHEAALWQAQRFHDVIGPDAANLHAMGRALAGLGRTEEALDAYRAGLDDDPDSIDNLAALARALPPGDKAEVTERFGRSAMTPELFNGLADALDGPDPAALRAVVEAYKAKRPEAAAADPYVAYYESRLHARAGRHADAADAARAGIAHATGDALDLLRNTYLRAAQQAGQAVPAYQASAAGAERDAAFRELASLLQNAEDAETLSKLTDARRADAPDDPHAHYCEGWLHGAKGDWAAADRAYGRAAAAPGALDEGWSRALRDWRVEARYRLGRSASALAEVGPAAHTFAHLARLHASDGDADGLDRLIAARAAADPSDPTMPLWRAELAWLRKDYNAAADLFLARYKSTEAAARAAADDKAKSGSGGSEGGDGADDPAGAGPVEAAAADEPFVYWPVGRRIVHSLLRAGRDDEALRFARREKAAHDTSYLLLTVHASAGRVDEAVRAFAACVEEGFEPGELYDDEDLGPLLRAGKFKPLHAKFPPEAPATRPSGDAP